MLREYQQRTIDRLYDWFRVGNAGNPCLVLPTGSGKSHIVAALCKDAIQSWPETRVLMLTHVMELISQNAAKMREHWPSAPLGIYSAGLGCKILGEPITFAGIQSVRERATEIGHVDLVIIDECHLVNHKDEGGYRQLLADLIIINPSLRVVGLTATPFRLGHGLITDAPALFHALIEPVRIEELVYKGYLSTLRSKPTEITFDISAVRKRGGEYIESELQAAVNTDGNNIAVVEEVIARAGDRKAWLFFCAGVDHAERIAQLLNDYDIPAACVVGTTPKVARDQMLTDFKAGRLRALTNANVLTTGFDYPDIDLIAMLRPTMSASLYVQMAGRGMRIKSHTDHCLVLDFAGVVQAHGPVTAIEPTKKKGDGKGDAPVKTCGTCSELVHISAKVCPACGSPFPPREMVKLQLRNDDIMGIGSQEMKVTEWKWRKHTSLASGKEMLSVSYFGRLSDPEVLEYFPVTHDGYAGNKAIKSLQDIATNSRVAFANSSSLDDWADVLNSGDKPETIKYNRDGRFYRVLTRTWS